MNSLPIDDENAPLYSVGQVADMLGVAPAFLRRLEAFEVIAPARSDGGQRRYSRVQIARAQAAIALMDDEGLTVAGTRHVLQLQGEIERLTAELAGRDDPAGEAQRDVTAEPVKKPRRKPPAKKK